MVSERTLPSAAAGREVFVGRAGELAVLEAAAAAARGGQPQVVLVEGGAGAGKSSLLARFAAGLGSAAVWSPCTLVDRFPLCRICIRNVNKLLKAHRAQFPQTALFPDTVVIPLDVVEYRGPDLFSIQPQMLVDELFLDRGVK